MAGHSKFKNIMHRKGAQDKKRAKTFSRLGREITVAVKTGGSDPDNRHSFRSKEYLSDNEKDLLTFVSSMSNIRKNSSDLSLGSYRSIFSDSTLIVFSRETAKSETIVMINSGTESRKMDFIFDTDIFYNSYNSLIDNESVIGSNVLNFTVEPQEVAIFTSNFNFVNETNFNETDTTNITEGQDIIEVDIDEQDDVAVIQDDLNITLEEDNLEENNDGKKDIKKGDKRPTRVIDFTQYIVNYIFVTDSYICLHKRWLDDNFK